MLTIITFLCPQLEKLLPASLKRQALAWRLTFWLMFMAEVARIGHEMKHDVVNEAPWMGFEGLQLGVYAVAPHKKGQFCLFHGFSSSQGSEAK